MTNNISLYFHIPFCVKKCDYCAFYSLANQSEETKEDYLNALLRQLDFFLTDRTVSSVYFGGGTPPMLGINRLCRLIEHVKSNYTLSSNCEITVEVNPKTVDFEGLKQLYTVGVNRLSVGVQSADDEILSSIGRIHTFADAVNCIDSAKAVGFTNISADLMFALPGQSIESLSQSIDRFLSLGVTHISCYSLQLEEGTPLYQRRSLLSLPDEESEEAQYSLICETLTQNGFSHYEISSFCKPNFHSRHNTAYWNRYNYIGFGAGAHSFYNNRRFSNVADVNKYIELSKLGLFAPTDYLSASPLSDEEALEEEIMLSLRTIAGARVPVSAYGKAERIASLGYGVFDNGILSLNSRGFRVSNAIIAEIVGCL